MERYAGTYYVDETLAVRRFAVRDGKLFLNSGELKPAGNGEFTTAIGRVRFSDGSKVTLLPDFGLPETGVRVAELHLDAPALSGYAGSYFSPELGVRWRIEVREGALHLVRPGDALNLRDQDSELRPLAPQVFAEIR